MTNDQLKDEEFCYINLDDERVSKNLSILQDIYDLHIRWYQNEPVFFFDEIQNVKGWEQFINRLYEKGAKIYITGS